MKILAIGELAGDLGMLGRVMEDVGTWKPDLVLFTGDVVSAEEREELLASRREEEREPLDWRDRLREVLDREADTYRRFLQEIGRFRGMVRLVPGHRDAPLSTFLRAVLKENTALPRVGLAHRDFQNVGRDFVLTGFGGDITADERETGLAVRFPEWEAAYALDIMDRLPQDPILLTHYPPRAETVDLVDGEHVGSPMLKEAIDRLRPAYVFCGHAHASQGVEAMGRTVVINPGSLGRGGYAIINTRKETVRFNMLEG